MKRTFPFLTSELAARIEACCMFFSLEKQKALYALPGNPYGVQIRSFGNTTALLAQRTHNHELFNHVGNISGDDLSYLDAIIGWYQSYDIYCHFDLVPSSASPLLLWSLASRGFYQSGFYNMLYGLPQTDQKYVLGITVRPVLPEEKDLFAEIYFDSFEIPKTEVYAYVRDSVGVLVRVPTNYCFFALIDHTIAAIAVLSIHRQVGYLALAGTLPSFRGHGCHKALLQARMHMAAQAGCNLIAGQAGVATISQLNMEKVGLRMAYTKAIWSHYDRQKSPGNEIDPTNR